jgi:hypothetical protein
MNIWSGKGSKRYTDKQENRTAIQGEFQTLNQEVPSKGQYYPACILLCEQIVELCIDVKFGSGWRKKIFFRQNTLAYFKRLHYLCALNSLRVSQEKEYFFPPPEITC